MCCGIKVYNIVSNIALCNINYLFLLLQMKNDIYGNYPL